MTEKECREFKVPYFDDIDDLTDFIDNLDDLNNDYGTSAYAMSLAGVAAFNYIAHRFGCTGFQAGCADLDMLRRTRGIEGPFMLVDLSDALYPQYNLQEKLENFIETNRDWLKEKAQAYLKRASKFTHPNVLAHWKKLAGEGEQDA